MIKKRVNQRWATPTPELEITPELTLFYSEFDSFNTGWSWSGVALTRSGFQVELELALFSNSDSIPIDLMTSKRTTKKLHRCPQRSATPTPELELTPELTLFYSELEWVTLGVAHVWGQDYVGDN
jgi:hypothetical protein